MSAGIIKHPHMTEKAMDEMDFDNKLQFIVDEDATKPAVSEAVEERYDVTVEKVNTQITMNGTKKATVRLSEEDDAQDVASRIGVF
ncbi:MAG: 50S ribosomal protein L23 [Halobacteriales archaeon]